MRKRIIDWFFTLQSQRGILGEKERRFYTYAYGLLLNKIAIYAIIAIVGTTTGNWIEMFSFLLPFTVLRQYAGGIHLEKPTSCIIFSGFRMWAIFSGNIRHWILFFLSLAYCGFSYIHVSTNRY